MADTLMKRHLGRVGKHSLTEDQGRLLCSCMKYSPGTEYQPCSHVWEAMRQAVDDGLSVAGNEDIGESVLVPLLKEPVNGAYLCAWVSIRHEQARHGMTPFYLERNNDDDEFVGWVAEDEGRYAMRRVLLEFIRAKYYEVDPCTNKTHSSYLLSPKERTKLDLNSTSQTVLAGVASVLMFGSCWRCLNTSNDDLIPDL